MEKNQKKSDKKLDKVLDEKFDETTVEKALYKKATGYKETLKKPIKCKTIIYDEGKKMLELDDIVYAEEDVLVSPDTTAMSFWLRNRLPDRWKNKPETDNTEADEGVLPALAEYMKNSGKAESETSEGDADE